MCAALREARDYSALPVLADLLEEAGYADQAALAEMRRDDLPRWARERFVALAFSRESADAVAWIDALVAELDQGPPTAEAWEWTDRDGRVHSGVHEHDGRMSYDRLLGAADDSVTFDDYLVEHGGEHWRDTMYKDEWSYGKFWAAWALVTGRDPPADPAQAFLSCSC
jgi:hypothetical protein